MTFRGLRNQVVFWTVAILLARHLHEGHGWLLAVSLAGLAAVVAVVVVALLTDRFLD